MIGLISGLKSIITENSLVHYCMAFSTRFFYLTHCHHLFSIEMISLAITTTNLLHLFLLHFLFFDLICEFISITPHFLKFLLCPFLKFLFDSHQFLFSFRLFLLSLVNLTHLIFFLKFFHLDKHLGIGCTFSFCFILPKLHKLFTMFLGFFFY